MSRSGMALMHNVGGTRLDAIVWRILRIADGYATARALSAAYGNQHGDEDAARHYRANLTAALRDELTRLVGEMPTAPTPESRPSDDCTPEGRRP